MRGFALVLIIAMLGGGALAQHAAEAQFIVTQEQTGACHQGNGTLRPEGLIARDLTGDGLTDYIVSHEHMDCSGRGLRGFCGAQVCSVRIYVREGEMFVPRADFLGGGVTVNPGQPPVISGYGHGGHGWSIRWDGSQFR